MPINNCCCGPICIKGSTLCPAGMASYYTISLPSIINWGDGADCAYTRSVLVVSYPPFLTSIVVTGVCPNWNLISVGEVAGYVCMSAYLDVGNDENGCAGAYINLTFGGDPIAVAGSIVYKKIFTTGSSVTDIIGVYKLDCVRNFAGTCCVDSYADSEITVSP